MGGLEPLPHSPPPYPTPQASDSVDGWVGTSTSLSPPPLPHTPGFRQGRWVGWNLYLTLTPPLPHTPGFRQRGWVGWNLYLTPPPPTPHPLPTWLNVKTYNKYCLQWWKWDLNYIVIRSHLSHSPIPCLPWPIFHIMLYVDILSKK